MKIVIDVKDEWKPKDCGSCRLMARCARFRLWHNTPESESMCPLDDAKILLPIEIDSGPNNFSIMHGKERLGEDDVTLWATKNKETKK